MINPQNLKKIFLLTMAISLLIPVISLAQESSDQTLSQQLTANSYSLEVPDGISFQPAFLRQNESSQVQRVLDPTDTSMLIKFTDLRGRSGGAFNIYASMSDLRTPGRSGFSTITVDNVGIASRSTSNSYSVDFDANNFLSADQETVIAPLDYNNALVDGEIPVENYDFFSSTSDDILIMDGTTDPGAPGRTGAYAFAPSLIINIPENSYGSFGGTLTFELVLS